MKYMVILTFLVMISSGCTRNGGEIMSKTDPQIMEVACGECMFDLPGDGCDLAVRINGQAFFVEGTDIDDHGDAHAGDGFCTTIRKARVQGEVIDGVYHVAQLELLPQDHGKYRDSYGP